MKKIICGLLLTPLFLYLTAFGIQQYLNWKIDQEKADVKFKMQAHKQELIGSFKTARGNIFFDSTNLGKASIQCLINVADIRTGIEERDEHLQDKDWFNAKQYPVIRFQSDSVYKQNGQFVTRGKLEMKGKSKTTFIPFTFYSTDTGHVFTGQFNLKLSDYNIPKVEDEDSDELTVLLNIPVIKQ